MKKLVSVVMGKKLAREGSLRRRRQCARRGHDTTRDQGKAIGD
jgi:hypothetical protein